MKIEIRPTIHQVIKTFGLTVCAGAVLLAASSAQAEVYFVNRSFTDGSSIATLTGTVDIPLGSYTIQNEGASPFTSVNLTLTVNATGFAVNNVLTGLINGTGQFNINATATTLTFGTANSNGGNPADLEFSDTTDTQANDRYVLGSNGDPQFEAGFTSAGSVLSTTVTFPTVFATAAPEPTTLALTGLGGMALMLFRRQRK
jgi:hypothetical protein